MLVLDQATAVAGYSLWEDGQLVKYGKVEFAGTNVERITKARQWLQKVVEMISADGAEVEVVLEDIQLQKDVVMFKTLAWLQGALLSYIEEKGYKHRLYFSTEWRSTCGINGSGRTEQKRQAQKYILDKFGIKATQDECEAICIGIHALAEDDKVVNW